MLRDQFLVGNLTPNMASEPIALEQPKSKKRKRLAAGVLEQDDTELFSPFSTDLRTSRKRDWTISPEEKGHGKVSVLQSGPKLSQVSKHIAKLSSQHPRPLDIHTAYGNQAIDALSRPRQDLQGGFPIFTAKIERFSPRLERKAPPPPPKSLGVSTVYDSDGNEDLPIDGRSERSHTSNLTDGTRPQGLSSAIAKRRKAERDIKARRREKKKSLNLLPDDLLDLPGEKQGERPNLPKISPGKRLREASPELRRDETTLSRMTRSKKTKQVPPSAVVASAQNNSVQSLNGEKASRGYENNPVHDQSTESTSEHLIEKSTSVGTKSGPRIEVLIPLPPGSTAKPPEIEAQQSRLLRHRKDTSESQKRISSPLDIESDHVQQHATSVTPSSFPSTTKRNDPRSDDSNSQASDPSFTPDRSRNHVLSRHLGHDHVDRDDAAQMTESSISLHDSEDEKPKIVCRICNGRFISKKNYNRHLSNPKSHMNLLDCPACGKTYKERNLFKHQRRVHGGLIKSPRRTGPFETWEVAKLEQYREAYCDEYNISKADFNAIMTATHETSSRWPYGGVTKKEFMDSYFDVLPDRDKRSMQRYRTYHFQNVDSGSAWTQEDDKELARLVRELGPKWREISQRLTRETDSVRRRWTDHVQLGEKRKDGNWSDDEHFMLVKVVNKLRGEDRLDGSPNVSWTAVSQELSNRSGHARTAIQCSNHWVDIFQRRSRWRSVRKGARKWAESPGAQKRLSSKYVNDTTSSEGPDRNDDAQESEDEHAGTQSQRRAATSSPSESNSQSRFNTEAEASTKANPRTPKQKNTLSQVFERTQATPQSSSRKSRDAAPLPSSIPDRPSPSIAINLRPVASASHDANEFESTDGEGGMQEMFPARNYDAESEDTDSSSFVNSIPHDRLSVLADKAASPGLASQMEAAAIIPPTAQDEDETSSSGITDTSENGDSQSEQKAPAVAEVESSSEPESGSESGPDFDSDSADDKEDAITAATREKRDSETDSSTDDDDDADNKVKEITSAMKEESDSGSETPSSTDDDEDADDESEPNIKDEMASEASDDSSDDFSD